MSSKKEDVLVEFMKLLKKELSEISNKYGNIEMLGPVPSIIAKIKDNFRWQIIFKGELSLNFCNNIKDRLYQLNKNIYNDIRVSIDINPNTLT
ncbi:MAG: hypothetical protein RSC44_02525 [Clostridia bacterium]